jgi:hypothetical protein
LVDEFSQQMKSNGSVKDEDDASRILMMKRFEVFD